MSYISKLDLKKLIQNWFINPLLPKQIKNFIQKYKNNIIHYLHQDSIEKLWTKKTHILHIILYKIVFDMF